MGALNVLQAIVHGFTSGAMLIIAIGAQNAFVLRQGLRREQVPGVVLVCALSDALLIQAGVWGVGVALAAHPMLAWGARWLGAAFLLLYALKTAARVCRPQAMPSGAADAGSAAGARARVLLTALALTWLNPHVYLDTVLLLGTIASPYDPTARAGFAAGATLASVLWFVALGYGARWLAPVFATALAWRILDSVIALTMVVLALGLVCTDCL
ncbi:LysE/ArgO family amino acid transporter [Verminephrobacter eiseniae]|uniref:LysE/ArgO family amino acid transporter n=1 Tax=Verminephrobacter eiseniae TaxID=364317 RepID=UPI0010E294A1|nr:LysE family transporter [Verminephrobacter eiseniae]KAB7634506.1 amino acid transporter [Verminephrobacter sp. Larva24]MCW5230537.1 amino acid transporter [Verminephrobacter eiseniae]MCW5292269.1 amino acid transporter [Verminephrobacter eiseniae]MCW8183279.1 amino acid transporter [Verminephrobacter eiseniae]MCW8224408.1 amino acid transporter [Verminephrobacter eiseniae]